MKKDIFEGFYAKFDNVKFRRGPGGNYPYVSADDVTDRMNKLFLGNWSSETKDYYETEHDVVVRVKVAVLDQDTNMWFYHEGYGGHRKNSNDEAGNSFKSAYSKALVNACRRWGVALYLTDDEPQVQSPPTIPTATHQYNTIPNMKTPPSGGSGVLNVPPTQLNVAPAPVNGHVPFPGEIKARVVPNIPVPGQTSIPVPGQTSIPVRAEVTVQQELIIPPMSTNLPKIPMPPVMNGSVLRTPAPITTPTDIENTVETISDVQKVSIESLIDIYGIPYDDMAQGALGKVIPIDNLTHSEAISIIQYGHKVYKNK